jgi:aspartate/methionine/tyrosine aminotransferase
MDPSQFISQRSRAVDASGIRKVFDLAVGLKDPINFSIGQPDYDVPDPVKEAAVAAIREGFNTYTPTQGLQALRDAIREELAEEFGDWPNMVMITSGVSGGLLLMMMAVLNPGDEVVFADPYFVMYKHLARLVGAVPVTVPSYPDFAFPAAGIEKAITPRTKMLLVNSPCNPTGIVYSDADLQAAADIARRHNLLVASDEIYEALCYEGLCPSIVSYAPERTILLRGFSKTYGMPGWRMGFAAGPEPILQEMAKLQQYTFVCAPSFAQKACLTALETDVSRHVADYRRKRNIAYQTLKQTFEVVKPTGGFYIFPRVPERFSGGTAFVEQAIARNVLVIPGNVFSAQDTHFRICYATSDEKIKQGCEILCHLAQNG